MPGKPCLLPEPGALGKQRQCCRWGVAGRWEVLDHSAARRPCWTEPGPSRVPALLWGGAHVQAHPPQWDRPCPTQGHTFGFWKRPCWTPGSSHHRTSLGSGGKWPCPWSWDGFIPGVREGPGRGLCRALPALPGHVLPGQPWERPHCGASVSPSTN